MSSERERFEEWARREFKREVGWDLDSPFLVHDPEHRTYSLDHFWRGWQAAASSQRVDYEVAAERERCLAIINRVCPVDPPCEQCQEMLAAIRAGGGRGR